MDEAKSEGFNNVATDLVTDTGGTAFRLIVGVLVKILGHIGNGLLWALRLATAPLQKLITFAFRLTYLVLYPFISILRWLALICVVLPAHASVQLARALYPFFVFMGWAAVTGILAGVSLTVLYGLTKTLLSESVQTHIRHREPTSDTVDESDTLSTTPKVSEPMQRNDTPAHSGLDLQEDLQRPSNTSYDNDLGDTIWEESSEDDSRANESHNTDSRLPTPHKPGVREFQPHYSKDMSRLDSFLNQARLKRRHRFQELSRS